MTTRRPFGTKDIGAELLPIITKGIYRDPLDTLREYVQNAIDAKASSIELRIGADLVSVRDNGSGMNRNEATAAIRLGISDKDPRRDVGFRGIGIYSAFNICDTVEIFTRTHRGPASKLIFDFKRIQSRLRTEERRRLKGQPARLYLEKLMKDAVYVEDTPESPIKSHGTLVMLVGIKGDVYRRLTNREIVRRYLQSVVPLPFRPEFRYKQDLESLFRKKDYPVVDVSVAFDGGSERLYRPYHNEMFTNGKGFGPKHWPLPRSFSSGTHGFAWVCLNDARKYLPTRELRGLLVKKLGFSVGGRDHFARYFGRIVFNNRVTGEIVITDDDLLPNAARSEFEPSPARDSLYVAFDELASTISVWAESVQTKLKAEEELDAIGPKVQDILERIPTIERDVPALLRLNTQLAAMFDRLATHKRVLRDLHPNLLKDALSGIEDAQTHIAEVLSAKGGGPAKRERLLRKALRSKTKTTPARTETRARSLCEAIRLSDLKAEEVTIMLLKYLDLELVDRLSPEEYAGLVEEFAEYLEELP